MAAQQSPTVVVTGASTGIGWGITKVLTARGARVFASVRRPADAERLASTFGSAVTPLLFDVTDEAAVRQGASQVAASLGGSTLSGLVNNAGIAVPAPLLHQPIADFRHQMEVNLVGQLIVTQAFAPLLGVDRKRTGKPGRIVNMSSVGGKIGAPFIGAYVASKHALEGLSETLRRELMLYRIDVILIGPGAVVSAIWDKAAEVDIGAYAHTEYVPAMTGFKDFMVAQGRRGYPAERVGEVVWKALTARKPKVRYAVVPQAFTNWTLPRVLPKRLLDRIVAGRLGFRGK